MFFYNVKVMYAGSGPLLLEFYLRVSFVLYCGNIINETALVVKGGFLFSEIRFLPSQASLPVFPLGFVELGIAARLAFLGVNPGDGIHVSPTLANSDVSIHCGDSLEELGIDVKRNRHEFRQR